MTTPELIAAILIFAVAGILLFLGARHFAGRGFLLNNAYLYASKEERKTMDKKPYYKQSAVVFCLLSAAFGIIGLSVVLQDDRIELLEIPVLIAVVVYAVVSTARIEKRTKK